MWYYFHDSHWHGPVSTEAMQELLASNAITVETLARQDEGKADCISTFSELNPLYQFLDDDATCQAGPTGSDPSAASRLSETLVEPTLDLDHLFAPELTHANQPHRSTADSPSLGKHISAEVSTTSRLLLNHIRCLYNAAAMTLMRYREIRTFRREHSSLGACLFEQGVGSEVLRQRIAEIKDRLTSMVATGGPVRHVRLERNGLYIRLATDYLQGSECAVRTAEAMRALESQKTVAEVEAHLQRYVSQLIPTTWHDRLRLTIAYSLLLLIALWLLM